ncbi:hypothetical protein LUZ60_003925 [Juncus effusus]|nr:hypothetical protein LUZ60_003925 [Juncus effusus]
MKKKGSPANSSTSNLPTGLVGPPGIPVPFPLPCTVPPGSSPFRSSSSCSSSSYSSESESDSDSSSDSDVYQSNYKKNRTNQTSHQGPIKTRSKHGSFSFPSTGNPCLDFFFHVVPDTHSSTVTKKLSEAWKSDPLTALKLICNLRAVRGTGKANREGFYVSALWLHENHPKTLALNLPSFAQFGYLKDLLEILYRVLQNCKFDLNQSSKRGKHREPNDKKEQILEVRKRKRENDAARALSYYASNELYRFLHDQVANFFAELLSSDLENLKSGEVKKIGLAAKWCPSLDSSYDRSTLICESIARKMFPRDSFDEYQDLSEEHYSYQIRNRLRKEVLSPLRKTLLLPEMLMSTGQWNSIPYSHVTSLAMKRYKDAFLNHDRERASEFLTKAETGEAMVTAGALQPHEILKAALEGGDDELAELQWKRLIHDLSKEKKFKSCLSVCHKSSYGENMEVSAPLALLISELTEEPWKGRIITFCDDKLELHRIEGELMKEKLKFRKNAKSDHSGPNIRQVFDEILRIAMEGNLKPEQMVKRVFIFSNMEFSNKIHQKSEKNKMDTDYEAICRKFEENGYGESVPQIVFWNLSETKVVPVLEKEQGVALVSGYSKNLVKLFLEMDGEISPEAVMNAAIDGDEYRKLKVFD